MIIGVAGTNAAGKSTVVRLLEGKGFATFSLSDVLREEARRRGLPQDRDTLRALGNEIRARDGAGALMREALRRVSRPDLVIDSIRNPAEAEELRRRSALIIGVDADSRVRFSRAVEREARTGRAENAPTFEEFLERERIENSDDPKGQQLGKVLAMADVVFRNDGTSAQLEKRVTSFLSLLPVMSVR